MGVMKTQFADVDVLLSSSFQRPVPRPDELELGRTDFATSLVLCLWDGNAKTLCEDCADVSERLKDNEDEQQTSRSFGDGI